MRKVKNHLLNPSIGVDIFQSTAVMDYPRIPTKRSLLDMERYAYCNVLVIAITCWVSFLGFRDPAFRAKYIFWPEAILAWNQHYRLVTSAFLHLNGYHLVANMVSLYFFGPRIEAVCGHAQFLAIYFVAVIGGDLLALYVHRYHDYRALGASGGVSGIIFAYILLFPGGTINIHFIIPVPSWLFAIVFLAGSFCAMQRGMNNVGHDAHLGGALVGLFMAASFHPDAIRHSPWWFGGITVLTILLFLYMARNPLFLPLDGIDLTRAKPRSSKGSTAFSLRRLFNFPRRKSPVPAGPLAQPERQVDALLRKISESGIDSLTKEEKATLNEISHKYRRRESRQNPQSGFPL
jgi:membrane associated rhomboid family serine protease